MIAILQAIFLGVVEGLTEFLPISSTGHLLVAEEAIGYQDAAKTFTVVIQLGAIAAVIWYFRKDLWQRLTSLLRQEKSAVRFLTNLVIATAPAAFIGLLLESSFDSYATLPVIALALIWGGFAIIYIEDTHHARSKSKEIQLEAITRSQALKIGLAQILALVPGVSRSGATIMGGLLSKLNRVTATAFSFYLSIPIIVMAGTYKLVKGWDDLSSISGGATALALGTFVSFVSALVAVGWLLKYVSTHNFKPFAYYRIALGVVLLIVSVMTR